MIQDDETRLAEGKPLRSGVTVLLRGTKKNFCVLIVDKGFTYWPHNVDTEGLTPLQEWCKENYVVLVCPDAKPQNKDPEWIFQYDTTIKKLIQKPFEEITVGRDTLVANHMRICTSLRSIIEQLFGALSQVYSMKSLISKDF